MSTGDAGCLIFPGSRDVVSNAVKCVVEKSRRRTDRFARMVVRQAGEGKSRAIKGNESHRIEASRQERSRRGVLYDGIQPSSVHVVRVVSFHPGNNHSMKVSTAESPEPQTGRRRNQDQANSGVHCVSVAVSWGSILFPMARCLFSSVTPQRGDAGWLWLADEGQVCRRGTLRCSGAVVEVLQICQNAWPDPVGFVRKTQSAVGSRETEQRGLLVAMTFQPAVRCGVQYPAPYCPANGVQRWSSARVRIHNECCGGRPVGLQKSH